MNTELQHQSEEYHVLADRLRECGHEQSAAFFAEVARRCDEALGIQELTDEWGRQ